MTAHSKLPAVGTTIFTVMSRLAAETGAINLSQGFPSFSPPTGLIDCVTARLRGDANQYAPMPGVAALCELIAAQTERLQGRKIDAGNEITISCGATEGLFAAIQAVVHPGDEVIVLDPAYDLYEPAVTLAGGRVRHVALAIDAGEFHIDWQRLSDAICAKTRLLIVNFPHNPTGAILGDEDLDRLAALLRDTDCLVLADEVYEHIVFDGRRHLSLLSHDELWPRSMVVSSFGKALHATGWKIGYCIAPRALSNEFRKVHQYTTFAISTPMQHGIADFLTRNPTWCEELAAFYQAKRDFFCNALAGSRFSLLPARATFFQVLDYTAISELSDTDLAVQWTHDPGVASIPLSVFCAAPFPGRMLRFCFAKDDATLAAAADRLRAL